MEKIEQSAVKTEKEWGFYDFKRVLEWLLLASRGGETRRKIVKLLLEKPRNTHQLSQDLGMEWGNINHHLKVLEKNGVLHSLGETYGKTFFISKTIQNNLDALNRIFNLESE